MSELLSADPRVLPLVESIMEIVVAPLRARVAELEARDQKLTAAYGALMNAAKPFVREGKDIDASWANERERRTLSPTHKPVTVGDYRAIAAAHKYAEEALSPDRLAKGPSGE